jgi:hypothetical protein
VSPAPKPLCARQIVKPLPQRRDERHVEGHERCGPSD